MTVRTSTWLTGDLANELFWYRDGELYWKKKRSNRCKSGAVGVRAPNGYINIGVRVAGKPRTAGAHQVVWVMHGGSIMDDLEIDHIDRDRANNRIENLRQATVSQNRANKVSAHGGWKGVYRCHNGRGWRVKLRVGQTRIDVDAGYCIYDAATIYNFYAADLQQEFAVFNTLPQPWLERETRFADLKD